MDELYIKLQKRLDKYSFGFPSTPAGIDIKLLKKFFTMEDAELFLKMSLKLETPDEVSARTGIDKGELSERLESMASRGLLFRQQKDGEKKYGAIPFMHGLVEFRIKQVDKSMAELIDEFFETEYNNNIAKNADLFLRTVPVNKSVKVEHHVAAFNDAAEILKNAGLIAVADCFCRKKASLTHGSCGKPLETCFMFGSMAQYYIDNNLGRRVDVDEALKILADAQDKGLVTQPSASQNPAGMCNCCGDCCGILGAVKKFPRPAEMVLSNHMAVIDTPSCIGCGTCLERCQMDAITIGSEGTAEINYDRCIGCGLCVIKCPSEAIAMQEKPDNKKRDVPRDTKEQMFLMAKKRGII